MTESMTRGRKRRRIDWFGSSPAFSYRAAIAIIVIVGAIELSMSRFPFTASKVSTRGPSFSTGNFYPMATAFVQRTTTSLAPTQLQHGTPKSARRAQHLSVGSSRHIQCLRSNQHLTRRSDRRRLSSDTTPPSTTTSLSASASETNSEPSIAPTLASSVQEQYCRSRLMFLQDEMVQLTGGNKDFNANSPTQRSMAIFGEVKSCTKNVLMEISEASTSSSSDYRSLSNDKRLLAQYILEFQELTKLQQQGESQLQQTKPIEPIEQNEQISNPLPQDVERTTTADSEQIEGTNAQQGLETLVEDSRVADSLSSLEGGIPKPSPVTEQIDVSPVASPTLKQVEVTTTIDSPNTTLEPQPTVTTPPAVRTRSQDNVDDGKSRKRQPRQRPITYEETVEGIFADTRSCKIDPYWRDPLLELSRSLARDLAKQLNPDVCPMGYDPDWTAGAATTKKTGPTRGKRVGFLGYCRDQKELFPKHVVLVRCGDFYETFGVDAMLLVEHVGLNPMGGKCRSGCPKQNIQATLDGLTAQGFSVAVFEELEPVGTSTAKKLKERFLAQLVSPASPTYLYDNWLLAGSGGAGEVDASCSLDGLPPPRPCVGVVHTAAGYSIVEVSLEERSVQYSERLTAEAVACRLAAYPPADPLVYVPTQTEMDMSGSSGSVKPSFLPRTTNSGRGIIGGSGAGNHRLRTTILNPHLIPDPSPGTSDADRYVSAIVDTILKANELQPVINAESGTTNVDVVKAQSIASVDDFTVTMASTATNPLYVETATQIGLMEDKTIPSLIKYVLDDAAPAATRRFLHRYLLIPPPPSVAQSMAKVIKTLIDETKSISLPPLTVPNLGKSLILIRAGQAGAGVYGELLQSLDTTMYVLESCDDNDNDDDDECGTDGSMEGFVEALLHMCEHESGLPAKRESLLERCQDAVAAIEAVVSSSYHVEEYYVGGFSEDIVSEDDYIPIEFFERNERSWRGRVQMSVAEDPYQRVRDAASQLSQAIREDFIGSNDANKALIKYNFFDNLIALNKIPSEGFEGEMMFVHPYDRFGKVLSNRWTTEKVKNAVSHYVSECENATNEVKSILSTLAKDLQDSGHIPAVIQSSHFNLILSAAFHHAVRATNSQWQLAETIEDDVSDGSGARFVDVFPYWMHKSKAVTNTFDLSSMILLTAPNMSGKSTLMRSTAAAALLTVCGLCAPLSSNGSKIPRFDTLFLRGASADVPTEDKSAFGAEMGDLAALFRCSGEKSLVFVDELGRGTSPKDGTRLAGAVLERMADVGMSGIFATHLHDVLELPLRKERIVTKRIKIDRSQGDSEFQWTHKLEDGVCKDSMALITAERFGLPDEIISRAKELTEFIPERSPSPMNPTKISYTADSAIADDQKENLKSNDVSLSDDTLDNNVQDDVDANSGAGKSWRIIKKEFQNEFHDVLDIASKLVSDDGKGYGDGDDDDDSGDDGDRAKTKAVMPVFIEIPPRHHPPASLANRSCLYVLQLIPAAPSAKALEAAKASYYVGETDSISNRLAQHRKKGGSWRSARAIVFPVGDKSRARYCESALIGELARGGYSLESIADGRTLRHFRD